jgi:DNA-binding phage protein
MRLRGLATFTRDFPKSLVTLWGMETVKTIDPKVNPKIGPNLARNLKRLMEAKGLTAYRVAKDSGISHPQIYRYLDAAESSDPSASTLIKLCGVLNCKLTDLLTI